MAENIPLPTYRASKSISLSTGATGLTTGIDVGGHTLSALQMSTAWTDAALTFQASVDGSNYFDLYSSTGGEITYTTTASRMVTFDPIFWAAFRSIKIRSGTAASPVAQAGARTLTLALQALGVVK